MAVSDRPRRKKITGERTTTVCSTPTCTSTPDSPAPAAGTATSSTSHGGRAAKGSRSSAPATLPIRRGRMSCGSLWSRPSPACSGSPRTPKSACGAPAPASCGGEVRFMLSAEISTIYRGGERTRKVHHLLYAPTFEAADRITRALSKIGNLASDGRPILGLDSRHLLEITLDGGPGCYLVPAHAWTPWFAVLGSKSGFDVVADCYGDLAASCIRDRDRAVLRSAHELAVLVPRWLSPGEQLRRAFTADARPRGHHVRRRPGLLRDGATRCAPATVWRARSSSIRKKASTT